MDYSRLDYSWLDYRHLDYLWCLDYRRLDYFRLQGHLDYRRLDYFGLQGHLDYKDIWTTTIWTTMTCGRSLFGLFWTTGTFGLSPFGLLWQTFFWEMHLYHLMHRTLGKIKLTTWTGWTSVKCNMLDIGPYERIGVRSLTIGIVLIIARRLSSLPHFSLPSP